MDLQFRKDTIESRAGTTSYSEGNPLGFTTQTIEIHVFLGTVLMR